MGTKKDKLVRPGEWAKHFRKYWKSVYWKKSRKAGEKFIKNLLKDK